MYRAKALLALSTESLAWTALLVGYDHEVSLCRTCRQRFGMPPGKWRQSDHPLAGQKSSVPTATSAHR
jgi:transcriptional regulator GlxA family with amidase domain